MSSDRASSPLGTPPAIQFGSGGGGTSGGEGCSSIIALVLFFGVPLGALVFLHDYLGSELFWLGVKLITSAICLTLIPSLSAAITKNLVLRAVIDVIFFSLFLVGAFWMFEMPFSVLWISYGIGLIAILELGGLLSMLNMNYTLASLKQNGAESLFQRSIEKIAKIVRYGQLVYTAIPLSILAGVIIGMVRLSPISDTLRLTTIITLSVVSVGLLVITIIEFVGMCHPFVYMAYSEGTELEGKLDRAYTVTEVRKVYLIDSMHSIILIVAITMVLSHLSQIAISDSIVILISLFFVLSFFFNQVPYMIGQSLMRHKLLRNIHGLEKGKALETMDKYMPLFPMARYIATLSMSGTAGYFIFRLLDKVFVDLLGNTFAITP